jgi:DNA-binding NarL/FixJ family response regulator
MREQSSIRVLIADDHEVVRRGLSLVLETEKDFCVVGEASTGQQALEVALQQRPDVLVLDLKMPDMDGIAVLKAVKRQAPYTRVVLLTGFEVDDAILRAVQEGADGFLFKDAAPAELCRAIRLVAAGKAYLQPEVTTKLVHLMAKRTTPGPSKGSTLTPREREVLRLMARGHSNQEIAELTGVSLETVRSHVKNILQKLDQPNRTRAVLYALRSDLVSLGDVAQ